MHGVNHAILVLVSPELGGRPHRHARRLPGGVNDYRNPALLAKIVVTLDIISDGRLTLGIGTG